MQYILALALLVVMLAIGVWDVTVSWQGKDAATVSAVMMAWCRQWPVIPLGFGIVIGHILWPRVIRDLPILP